jgi:hypothetical protein
MSERAMIPGDGADRESVSALDEALAGAGAEASDPNYFVVRGTQDVERLSRDILGDREDPVVGLTHRVSVQEPVLRCRDVRTVVGAGVRVYLLADEQVLGGLRKLLGSALRLDAGSIRIWWPGASPGCNPAEHPQVIGLQDEDYLDTLAQFAQEYHLSRPLVRAHVSVIEDARTLLEQEIVRVEEHTRRVHERLRDAHIECHTLRTRAHAAEARLGEFELAVALEGPARQPE